MKYLIFLVCATLFLCSCNRKPLVNKLYVDSLVAHYTVPGFVNDNVTDMIFWKNRINPKNPQNTNESRYAATLLARFRQFGDIEDVKQAESIYKQVSSTYNHKIASPYVSLVSSAMLQHHFSEADSLLDTAKKIGFETYNNNVISFDVNFELGHYNQAAAYLNYLKGHKDYNYYFRRSKYDHLNGDVDSAISSMMKAAALTKSPYLKDLALSNAGDLYIHSGDLKKAVAAYKECIRLNNTDFHSILGLGWVALVHDKNDTLAERLFKFVLTKNKLPDPLFKLYQAAQLNGNKVLERQYATDFVKKASESAYGRMYNKYIIEIYTGILNEPEKAETLAKEELNVRATPQTYAWYAYTLLRNNKKADANKIFEQGISGRPLEGLELYYTGKVLKGLGKGYDASKYFDAASKNKYDLSPEMAADLAAESED